MIEYWFTAGLAAALGALIGAGVSIWTVTRNIKHKSVIEERQKWRDSLRELLPEFVYERDEASRKKIRDSIVLRLNPYKDGEAIKLIDEFLKDPTRPKGEMVIAHFQAVLKFDWERAKIEASICPLGVDRKANKRVRNQRDSQIATE